MQISVRVVHRHGYGKCASCQSRKECKTLCSEVEAIADQDYVPQREITIGFPMAIGTETEPETVKPQYTPMQKSIVRLLLLGHSADDICELLEISKESYYMHASRIRRKSKELLDSLLK